MNYQKLWKNAEKIIPGGNSLLSKRPKDFSKMENGQLIIKGKGNLFMDPRQ